MVKLHKEGHFDSDPKEVLISLFEMAEKEFIPLVSMIELTHRCNQRCMHCYIEEYGTADKRELKTKEIKVLIDDIASLGGLYLTLTGGEVFLRKDIFEIIEYARKKEFALTIFTNGTIISQKIAKQLKKFGIMEISISLYSTNPKLHDSITKLSGSFSKSISGIKNLKDAGIAVCIKCPLMKINLKEYRKIMKLAKKLGCRAAFDSTIVPRNDGTGSFKELRLDKNGLRKIFKDKKLYPFGKMKFDTKSSMFCGAGRNVCAITPYGDVLPCLQLLKTTGNIRKKSFKGIWRNSAVLKRLRSITDDKLENCCSCGLSRFCSRCAGLALLEDKNLYGRSKAACSIAKVRAEIASP